MHIELTRSERPIVRCRPCKKYVPFSTVYDAFIDWFSRLDDEEYRYSLVEPIDSTVSKEQELQNELDKLEVSRQRFNRAYGDSVMSYDDYKTEIERIKAKEKTLLDLRDNERQRAILHRNREARLGQLQEIGEIGIAMLEHDDPAQANVWLREFFKVAIDEDGNAEVFLR
jgi:hypothetical protein